MSNIKLTAEEIKSIMSIYDLEGEVADFNSEAAFVLDCLQRLEYDPDYEYQFEDGPDPDDMLEGEVDLYGQAVDRVAAYLKYQEPIIDEDFEDDE